MSLTSQPPPRTLVDPIQLEILSNALRSVADECFAALTRSAHSTNIKERKDHSTAIIDPQGRLIVQAEQSLPIHIASMKGLMRALLDRHGDAIAEGDMFIANDPHVAGGTHLPDVNVATPVFVEAELICFVCNIAHHADIGGATPGSMGSGLTEIYQEGLRIPLIKLFDRGVLREDLLELLLLNVRVPDERRGDYNAQIAAARLGERRMKDVIAQFGRPAVQAGAAAIIERAGERMRAQIRTIPDGVYTFEDVMDGDGAGAENVTIRVAITVDGEKIRFDFTGTAPQTLGNINTTLNATEAAVCYCLLALLDPDAPNNQGVLDAPEIIAPKGCLLNSVFPAAVAARANTCQRIIDVVIGALAPALPEQVVAAANGANTSAVFSGVDPVSGRPYVYLETLGGGFGGRARKDGADGVQAHITNTSNLPVEAIELEYPLRVVSYELIEDSGGPGRNRGGLGLRRRIQPVDHACQFSGTGERFTNAPWGVFGGGAGRPGGFALARADGAVEALAPKGDERLVRAGETVSIETPGAGGYGAPRERDAEALARDRRSGKFSEAFVAEHYGAARADDDAS